ncbi:RNA polymerase sigma factor [Halocola ammonii]
MKFFQRKISSLSDEDVLARYQNTGDKKWVGVLFDRYAHLVFGVGMKYLKDQHRAEEAMQNLFEKLMSKLKDQDVKNFRGWLHTVARNECLMILRKKGPVTTQVEESLLSVPEESEQPLLKEAKLEKLEAAIISLKPDQQKCIRLFYLEEKSYRQIVESTDFTLKEVKSHIQNGKRNLKNALENEEEFTSPGGKS